MQYILSEEEYKRGCELVEVWRETNLTLEEVYDKSRDLNNQGFFTIVQDTSDTSNKGFNIIVMKRLYD